MDTNGSVPAKIIQEIQVGAVDQDKVGWIFTYVGDQHESFALHLPIATQFHEALGTCIRLLAAAQPPGGIATQAGLGEHVRVQLSPPSA